MENKNTDLTIFTNIDENGIKLTDRFRDVLSDASTLDILVGYFRLSGYYLLEKEFDNINEIRILVGLECDPKIVNNLTKYVEAYCNSIVADFRDCKDDSLESYNGIKRFQELYQQGRIKIKLCKNKNVHAKVYIVHYDKEKNRSQYGCVITGSSNFSLNGLEKNIEFNVELKDGKDVDYASKFFNSLWDEAIPLEKDKILDTIKNKTWIKEDITPYELYLKTLFTYFEEEINSEEQNYDWPNNFMRLEYQEHAVTQARKILDKHGGVFISDVVGLGKTYIAAMLGKKLKGKKLFIVPPVVKQSWEEVISDFGYSRSDVVESAGKIDKILSWSDLDEFENIFIDEAHRFRNADSITQNQLKEICFNKKVILITATPQNNEINDIKNLIGLFQDSKNSSIIPHRPNLEAYFNDLSIELKTHKQSEKKHELEKSISKQIREDVLRNILIRRTRSEIIKYYQADLDKQRLKFPTLEEPKKLVYFYDDEMEKSFKKSIEILSNFTYARFSPLLYLKDKSIIGSYKARQENMKGFIKTILVKRLESSIYAFKASLDRIKKSTEDFLELVKKDRIPVGGALNFSEILELDDTDYNEIIINKSIQNFKKDDFENTFFEAIEKDYLLLNNLISIWSNIDLYSTNGDLKYEVLEKKLLELQENKQKVIIFSEATDTVNYLYERLKSKFGEKVIDFNGSEKYGKKEYIRQNFDPKIKDKSLNELDFLITTDALSEGINLHKASVVINYDLPWNPTRVMQRVGRINRVGSSNEKLYIYNFFPSESAKEHLSLEDAIKTKINLFHNLLGDDVKTITDDEVTESHGLYDSVLKVNDLSSYDSDDINENESELQYIQLAKEIKKSNKQLYKKIMELPLKFRVATSSQGNNGLVTLIKCGLNKKFIYCDKDNNCESTEIPFDEAIQLIKCDETKKSIKVPQDYFDLYNKNLDTYEGINHIYEITNIKSGHSESKKEKEINKYIQVLLASSDIDTQDREYLKNIQTSIKNGGF